MCVYTRLQQHACTRTGHTRTQQGQVHTGGVYRMCMRVYLMVSCIDVSSMSQQQLHDFQMAFVACNVQRLSALQQCKTPLAAQIACMGLWTGRIVLLLLNV